MLSYPPKYQPKKLGDAWVSQVRSWLKTPLGWAGLAVVALSLAVGIVMFGPTFGAVAVGLIIGIPIVLVSLFNLQFGMLVILAISFFILEIKRFSNDTPIGLLVDVLTGVTFFGLILKQIRERDWRFARAPITLMLLLWLVYNLLEVANPAAASRLAWVYTIRSIAFISVIYFVSLYAFRSIDRIKWVFYVFLGLAMVAALYTLKQEYLGLSEAEMIWAKSDPELWGLLFQSGKIRKFSFLAGPMTLGIVMAYSCIMCFIFAQGPISFPRKVGLLFMAFIMMLAALYTGTRTAYLLIPIGFIFYTGLTLRRSAVIAAIALFIGGMLVLSVPTVNADHHRIKTAFSIFGSKEERDPSLQVRLDNQKMIQPFIQSHPIGGGLGSTGMWGQRFSPNTMLANFPPDSGYIRVAVEQGWVGLLLYLAFLFAILRTGIRNYFASRDPQIRTYYEVCITFFFILFVANYPQEAITQIPTNFMFYILMALIVNLRKIDENPFPTRI